MDKNKIYKIIFTIISFIVLVGSIVWLFYLYDNTYGQRDDNEPKVTLTKTTSTE